MKTIYKLDGKKISKKALVEKMGAERVNKMTEEAWMTRGLRILPWPSSRACATPRALGQESLLS